MDTNINNEINTPAEKKNEKPKVKYDIDNSDPFVAAGCVITGIMFSFWSLFSAFRLGWTITFDFFMLICSAYLLKSKPKILPYPLICGTLSVLLSANFVITSNELVNICSFFTMIILASVWLASLTGKYDCETDTGYIRSFFLNTFGSIPMLPVTLRSLLNTGKEKNNNIKKILVGLLCAFPLICIVVPLLMDSDDAFNGLVETLIGDLSDIIIGIVLAIIVSPLLFNYIITTRRKDFENKAYAEKSIDNIVLTTCASALSVIYIIYIVSQLAYFFSAFSSVLPEGYNFTYAEYARKGFFEMCVVSCINLIVVFVIVTFSHKKNSSLPVSLKLICIFICAFTLLLIATAISKMVMYIDNFGMTQLRICTSTFMIFLFILFIMMIVKCFAIKTNIVKAALPLAAIFLIVLGFGNINSVIAKYNFNAYMSGKLPDLDIQYINELGPEGVPYLAEAYLSQLSKSSSNEKTEEIENCLKGKIVEYYSGEFTQYFADDDDRLSFEEYNTDGREFTKFHEMNIPLKKAYTMLDEFIVKYPSLLVYTYYQPEDTDLF